MRLYYLQNGYVGNSVLWYRKNGKGYTTRPEEAHIFTEKEAQETCQDAVGKYIAWPKDHVDQNKRIVIDGQDLDRRLSTEFKKIDTSA